jgi:hypothetical protein
MTSQDHLKAQLPPRREASFIEKVTWTGIGILLGGTVIFGLLDFLAADDDDRPPIIVRNGTVHLEVSKNGADGLWGELKDPNGENIWSHSHRGKEPRNFSVVVTGLDTTVAGSCSSSRYFYAQRAKKVTVSYSVPGAADRNLTFEIVKYQGDRRLQIKANPAAVATPIGDYALDFDGPDVKLKSVTIEHKNKDDVDQAPVCTFPAGSGEVLILQRK